MASLPEGESFTWTGETSKRGMRPRGSETRKGGTEKCTEAETAVLGKLWSLGRGRELGGIPWRLGDKEEVEASARD